MEISKEELIELVEDSYQEYVEEEQRINGIVDYVFCEIGNYFVHHQENKRIVCETLLRLLQDDATSNEYKELQDILLKLNKK